MVCRQGQVSGVALARMLSGSRTTACTSAGLCVRPATMTWQVLMFVLPTLTCIFNASALFVFGVVVDQLFPSLGTLAAPTPPVEKGRNKDFKPIECTYRRFEGQLGGDDVDGTCSICLEEFQSQDLLAELPCRHVFHAPCAHQWMYSSTISSRTVCPMRCKVHAKNQEKQRWPTDTYYV
eukprot:TRINITY_DN58819_c0_g1_i1.p1 TRINITY_DN58819_c0_g1~~TRINITY_DN58819_c0_g1_i1.p1  ORF type:complete len:179 (-),score=14.36 TRINITY_DN58819_c0_g1_i1:46-582(-)